MVAKRVVINGSIITLVIIILIGANVVQTEYITQTTPSQDIWQTEFGHTITPTQSTSYGTIRIGQKMSIEFDVTFHGRSNDPLPGDQENFFRIGHNATYASTGGTGCAGDGCPSMWLTDSGYGDMLYIPTRYSIDCRPRARNYLFDYDEINFGILHHIKISKNGAVLQVWITGGGKQDYHTSFPRYNPTQEKYINVTVPIWFMSDSFYPSMPFNVGSGTFSNIIIKSSVFCIGCTDMPTVSPTAEPTNQPTTYEPTTFVPTSIPTKKPTNYPTMSPTNYPTHQPTVHPTNSPITEQPTQPTLSPITKQPTQPTLSPSTRAPTEYPTIQPTNRPVISKKYLTTVTLLNNVNVTSSILMTNESISTTVIVVILLVIICFFINIICAYFYGKHRAQKKMMKGQCLSFPQVVSKPAIKSVTISENNKDGIKVEGTSKTLRYTDEDIVREINQNINQTAGIGENDDMNIVETVNATQILMDYMDEGEINSQHHFTLHR